MTHDPMCHLSRETGEFNLMAGICYHCKLIAKVRADERSRIADAVAELGVRDSGWIFSQNGRAWPKWLDSHPHRVSARPRCRAPLGG